MARFSKRSLEGEILIDHSASPGLRPEDLGTFDAPAVPKGELYESPLIVCGHCQYAVILNPNRTRDRGWCQHCDQYLCDGCTERLHVTLRCDNFQMQIDRLVNAIESHGTSPLLLQGNGHRIGD